MGQHVTRTDFEWVATEEPHASRRKEILAKYPQIKKLFGYDPNFKWIVLGMMSLQLVCMFLIKDQSWPVVMLAAYCIGGVINHSLMLAIHEISHNLAFGHARPLLNRWFGIFVNFPIILPFSISFKIYHLEHHRYQGDEIKDTDIPTYLEAKLFCTTFGKFCWVALQPLFYAFRPLVVYPKSPSTLEIINVAIQMTVNVLIYQYFEVSQDYSFVQCVSQDMKCSAGIAKQFREKYNGIEYLKSQNKKVGEVAVLPIDSERYLINLITKDLYYKKPNIESVERCLWALKRFCLDYGVKKIAMPLIACGLDKMDWNIVQKKIEYILGHTVIDIKVFTWREHHSEWPPLDVPITQKKTSKSIVKKTTKLSQHKPPQRKVDETQQNQERTRAPKTIRKESPLEIDVTSPHQERTRALATTGDTSQQSPSSAALPEAVLLAHDVSLGTTSPGESLVAHADRVRSGLMSPHLRSPSPTDDMTMQHHEVAKAPAITQSQEPPSTVTDRKEYTSPISIKQLGASTENLLELLAEDILPVKPLMSTTPPPTQTRKSPPKTRRKTQIISRLSDDECKTKLNFSGASTKKLTTNRVLRSQTPKSNSNHTNFLKTKAKKPPT